MKNVLNYVQMQIRRIDSFPDIGSWENSRNLSFQFSTMPLKSLLKPELFEVLRKNIAEYCKILFRLSKVKNGFSVLLFGLLTFQEPKLFIFADDNTIKDHSFNFQNISLKESVAETLSEQKLRRKRKTQKVIILNSCHRIKF